MSLHELPASELARIDAVCLDYEAKVRSGQPASIDEMVRLYGGRHAEVLRRELELVQQELLESSGTSVGGTLPGKTTPGKTTPGKTTPGEASAGEASAGEALAGETSRGDRTDSPQAAETLTIDATTSASTPTAATTSAATLSPFPASGTRIGPYVIARELGRGGMGVVFAAVDTRLDRRVAIKMLAVETSQRTDLSERFEREARAVAALSHPNIVELFDVGVFNGLPYAVMEFLDGKSLDQILSSGELEPCEVRRIGGQIADALAAAHEANVIHRDLKPQNVMLLPRRARGISGIDSSAGCDEGAEAGIVKLFDFGLSRAPEFSLSAEETGSGLIMGTPGYMSPEQVRGERVTAAADIFSLGCILYEAFYGIRPFDGRTNSARFSATLHHQPQPDPVRRREDIELAELIQECLRKEADQRPQSAGEIAQRLRSGITPLDRQREVARDRDRAQRVTRRRLLAMTVGGVSGGLVGAILARGDHQDLTRIRSLAVLAFVDQSADAVEPANSASPFGDRELERGEQLPAMLVHELTRLSEVTIPRFRPLLAETPSEFRELGELLEVDALLTGNLRTVPGGAKTFMELDLQIISSRTGGQLWGKTLQVESADNLLELSSLATEVASVIGHRLTSTADEAAPLTVDSFNCLVSARTRSDPDSPRGLEMALSCFQRAHHADRTFADPLAGIALTSITLAAQSDTPKSIELIQQARESAEEALAIDPSSLDAQLAVAMLDWQTLARYRQAERAFQELIMVNPNHWQVRHQYGLFLLATQRFGEAMQSLREAWQLHPLSMSVKVDHARAHWYNGNESRAIQDATRLRDRYDDSLLARGLLVDIFEQQGRYDLAARVDGELDLPANVSAETYYEARRQRLSALPYGPFGTSLNAAILQARSGGGLDDLALADLTDPMMPMLPLLLSVHPGFASARALPRSREILPTEFT